MLDIKYIREHQNEVQENAKHRGVTISIESLLKLDDQRRNLIMRSEELRATRRQGSKTKPTEEQITNMRQVGDEIAKLEEEQKQVQVQFDALASTVPNLTHPDVPIGGEADFRVLKTVGKKPTFDFQAKNHEELLVHLGLIDFERAAKVTGAKFYFTQGALVRLNQALINYGIDVVTKHGYQLMETPDVAKDEILQGIGFNPRGPETQVYSLQNTNLSLIGTAEITVGGYHANEILDLSSGPKKYVALSHCFRTEAGAHGRESKGLYRVHQFTKLEMFVYCRPEESEKLHQEILAIEEELATGLGLAYRVIDVASGDLGGPAYRKFDLEAWMVMKDGYGEITSTSNCTEYQARRLNIRYRVADGQTALAYTLNGTAINTSRWPLAIIEQYQHADGSISIPEVLRPYMGGRERLE
jgi:seryl-tRNA synthetase